MNKLSVILTRKAYLTPRLLASPQNCFQITTKRNKSEDSDSKQENEKQPDDKKNNSEAVNRLNSLLQKMLEDEPVAESSIKLARPTRKQRDVKSHKVESVEKQMVKAVKNVAESIGGDVKKTESELLLKLLKPEQSESGSSHNLSDIVKGMKIDRESKPVETQSRAQLVKQLLNRVNTEQGRSGAPQRKPRLDNWEAPKGPEIVRESIDLFGGTPLGIFTEPDKLKPGVSNASWDKFYERDLKLAVTHPPANYFQQMILWTEQGKVWKFPVDNEQGLDEEKQVCFSEHVFLKKYLEPWCPHKGPIRHFMELVCVGLSKNPYLSVAAKKEHIEWYKSYFDSKKDLLKEVGALPVSHTETQQIADGLKK